MRNRGNGSPILSHQLTVSRTARYCTLGPHSGSPRQIWLACHGYSELAADFLEGLRALEAPDRLVVAPEALSRFYLRPESGPSPTDARVGASWMTREDRLSEIEDYVGYLDRVWLQVRADLERGTAAQLFALGFSQGAATIARWAARTAAPIAELILWAGRLPPELDLASLAERWQRLRVTLVLGARDQWFDEPGLRQAEAQLRHHSIAVRTIIFQGGHRLDDSVLLSLAQPA